MPKAERPRVGVSACLVGDRVRYDGKDKAHRFLVESLGPYVEWVRVCPEVEIGLGVPRPKIHLVADESGTRMIQGQEDLSAAMATLAERRIRQFRSMGLHGYITKSRSPSCGLTGVEVWRGGQSSRDGLGHFVGPLREACPEIPLCEESDLEDAARRESMSAAIFLLHRWEHRGPGIENLRRFHQCHRLFWVWRGADPHDGWDARFHGDGLDHRELERAYLEWMVDTLDHSVGEREVLSVAEFTGVRVSPRQTLSSMLDELRRTLFDQRPELRPDRFFDPYPPELGPRDEVK